MPIVYLTPEDLSPAQAAKVLNFLNSANTAEEIGAEIEIADELDVGVGVGQRILDYRARLPDGFTDLQQLMDVPYVGPERFTEIVAVITGMPLPQFQPATLETMIQRELARQLATRTRESTPDRGEPYRIVVQPPAELPWVGQEITLTVKVLSSDTQKPVPNLAVTFESSSLILSTQFGYEVREGQVISNRTATDGSIRLRLRNLFDEPLTGDQQAALTDVLRRLPPDAAVPGDMLADWQNLTTAYQDVRNKRLRAAVDIIYRSASRQLTDTVNQQDNLYRWRFRSDLLRIYLGTDSADSTASTTLKDATAVQVGVHHAAWREWLRPWYQVYLEQLSGNQLQQTFIDAKTVARSESAVTANILGHAYRFVAEQNGLLGEKLSQQIMGREIQHFLAREITDFSAQSQSAMYPSLLLAGDTISRANTGTLALVNQSRAEVENILDERIASVGIEAGEINNVLDQLNQQMAQLDLKLNRQDAQFGELRTDIGNLQSNLGGIDSALVTVQSDIESINSDIERLDSSVIQLNTDYGLIDTRVTGLQTDVQQIDTQVSGLQTNLQQIDTQVTGLQTDVQTVNTSIDQLDTQVNTLNNDALRVEDVTRNSSGEFVDINTTRTPIRRF